MRRKCRILWKYRFGSYQKSARIKQNLEKSSESRIFRQIVESQIRNKPGIVKMNEKIREMTSSQELRNIFRQKAWSQNLTVEKWSRSPMESENILAIAQWKWNQDSRSSRKIGGTARGRRYGIKTMAGGGQSSRRIGGTWDLLNRGTASKSSRFGAKRRNCPDRADQRTRSVSPAEEC